MLLVAVARSSFGGVAKSYVVPVLWLTSGLIHMMGRLAGHVHLCLQLDNGYITRHKVTIEQELYSYLASRTQPCSCGDLEVPEIRGVARSNKVRWTV